MPGSAIISRPEGKVNARRWFSLTNPFAPTVCHPEARAFCGPKDLCNLTPLRRCRQIAQVLRFAQM